MSRSSKKLLLGIIITLLFIAVAFIVTVLVMASVHGLSFVEEIQSWVGVSETVSKVEGSVKAMTNVFRIK